VLPLSNEKLINLNFYHFIESKIEEISKTMLTNLTSNKKTEKIVLLIVTLILHIAMKEEIKIKGT
jgi:hypothetical protein